MSQQDIINLSVSPVKCSRCTFRNSKVIFNVILSIRSCNWTNFETDALDLFSHH